ncbi:SURF1 family protein [Actinotalea sp. K2]|uniref:SURF1 family protein n=1 Tax=Actinotalea sp. K2 TaxID=2939438 RepID=UPI002017DC43|nr:SURF1 family protein [Actinotalea sp. K2]MCL3859949.1 SURF1 family protein [Actinotalea sp. K2]
MSPRAPSYLRTALTPRMLVLLVLLLAAAAVCGRLGVWQLDRAQVRGEAAARAEVAAVEPLDDVLAPQTTFRGDLVGRQVTVSGQFEGTTLLVPGRALDGETGYLLLDALRVAPVTGTAGTGEAASGPVLAVVRGWVDETAARDVPRPPAGEVDLLGYLQAGEAAGERGLPPGQVEAVSPAQLVNRWGGPIYSGYLVLVEPLPGQSAEVALLPPPGGGGGGLDLQNLAYAVQWWIFGGFAVLLWLRMVRDEARAEVEDEDGPGEPDGPDEPAGPGEDSTQRVGERSGRSADELSRLTTPTVGGAAT